MLEAVKNEIRADAFAPAVKQLGCGDFSNALEIFEALKSGRLSASPQ